MQREHSHPRTTRCPAPTRLGCALRVFHPLEKLTDRSIGARTRDHAAVARPVPMLMSNIECPRSVEWIIDPAHAGIFATSLDRRATRLGMLGRARVVRRISHRSNVAVSQPLTAACANRTMRAASVGNLATDGPPGFHLKDKARRHGVGHWVRAGFLSIDLEPCRPQTGDAMFVNGGSPAVKLLGTELITSTGFFQR